MMVASNSVYGQDQCSPVVVKNFCCDVYHLGVFLLVCLGDLFREDFFPMMGVAFFEEAEEISG